MCVFKQRERWREIRSKERTTSNHIHSQDTVIRRRERLCMCTRERERERDWIYINIQEGAFVHGSNKILKVASICQSMRSVLNDLCYFQETPLLSMTSLPPSAPSFPGANELKEEMWNGSVLKCRPLLLTWPGFKSSRRTLQALTLTLFLSPSFLSSSFPPLALWWFVSPALVLFASGWRGEEWDVSFSLFLCVCVWVFSICRSHTCTDNEADGGHY